MLYVYPNFIEHLSVATLYHLHKAFTRFLEARRCMWQPPMGHSSCPQPPSDSPCRESPCPASQWHLQVGRLGGGEKRLGARSMDVTFSRRGGHRLTRTPPPPSLIAHYIFAGCLQQVAGYIMVHLPYITLEIDTGHNELQYYSTMYMHACSQRIYTREHNSSYMQVHVY